MKVEETKHAIYVLNKFGVIRKDRGVSQTL